jgi:hypothetical protein
MFGQKPLQVIYDSCELTLWTRIIKKKTHNYLHKNGSKMDIPLNHNDRDMRFPHTETAK